MRPLLVLQRLFVLVAGAHNATFPGDALVQKWPTLRLPLSVASSPQTGPSTSPLHLVQQRHAAAVRRSRRCPVTFTLF